MTAEAEENRNDLIRAVVKYPGKEAEVVWHLNTLRGYQKVVEGYIESVPFPGRDDSMDIVMNDEGKILKQEANIFVPEYKDIFVGPIIAVGVTEDLTWRSLTDEEIEYAKSYFKEHECIRVAERGSPERDIL